MSPYDKKTMLALLKIMSNAIFQYWQQLILTNVIYSKTQSNCPQSLDIGSLGILKGSGPPLQWYLLSATWWRMTYVICQRRPDINETHSSNHRYGTPITTKTFVNPALPWAAKLHMGWIGQDKWPHPHSPVSANNKDCLLNVDQGFYTHSHGPFHLSWGETR